MFTPRPSKLAGNDASTDLIRPIPLDFDEDYGYECALPYLDRAFTWTGDFSRGDKEPSPPAVG